MRILGWTYTGFRVLTNSSKPVHSVDDLQGLVIRVPKNEIMIETYKSWGMDPTPMAWSETFASLQQKVVYRQDNYYLNMYSMNFYEVQDHIANIRYSFPIKPLIISEAVFQDLSEEEQQVFLEAGKEATLASAAFLCESEAAIKEDLVAKSMEIVDPENNEEEFISLATAAVWPMFYEGIDGKDKLNARSDLAGSLMCCSATRSSKTETSEPSVSRPRRSQHPSSLEAEK